MINVVCAIASALLLGTTISCPSANAFAKRQPAPIASPSSVPSEERATWGAEECTEIQKKACEPDETCRLKQVHCVTAPCPKMPECVPTEKRK